MLPQFVLFRGADAVPDFLCISHTWFTTYCVIYMQWCCISSYRKPARRDRHCINTHPICFENR